MGVEPHDWMTAAACTEGPRPAVTFADLPPQHQEEMVNLALVAAAAAVYFVTLAVLSAPLASRSFAADAVMPQAVPARSAALEVRLLPTIVDNAPARPRFARPRPAVALAALREPAGGPPATSSSPRKNPLSRFFRGVLRTVAPSRSQTVLP